MIAAVCLVAACAVGRGSDEADSETSAAGATPSSDSTPTESAEALIGAWFLDVDWRAIGTEPFWGVHIRRDGLVFSEPAEDPVVFPPSEPRRAGDGFTLSSSLDGIGLEVSLRPETCSDGMSDRRYDWSARVEFDGRQLDGCAIRDPLPTVISPDGPIAAAGLTELVESARRIRAEGRYERVEGTLGRQRGADADFVAWFDGDAIVAIDLRVARGLEPLFETSYFFDSSGIDGEAVLRLVDSDSWHDRTREHTSYLIGFDVEGSFIGGLHEVDGHPTDPGSGLAGAELAGARDLIGAALRTRADQRRRSDGRT